MRDNKQLKKNILAIARKNGKSMGWDELAIKAHIAREVKTVRVEYVQISEEDYKDLIWDLLSDHELELTSERDLRIRKSGK